MVDFVAEFSINHLGNIYVLLRMVNEAVAAGATYIKMMKKDVYGFYSPEKLATPYNTPYGKTFGEYRASLELFTEDFALFDTHCKEHHIPWFTTVHDIQSLEEMLKWDLPIYKIASCNARNKELLNEVAASVPSDRTIVLSVGGSKIRQIESALNFLTIFKHIHLLHCVSEYPCIPANLRLGNIRILKSQFEDDRIKVGYSGHEEGIYPSVAAAKLGAHLIERHFCLSRKSFVHHIECALEPKEFQKMIKLCHDPDYNHERFLPPAAFESLFGMTDTEQAFLEKSKYGIDFITDRSRI